MIPFFGGGGIDRADAIRGDPDALAQQRSKMNARLLRLDGIDPVFGEAGGLSWGSLAEASDGAEFLFIGIDGDAPRFAALPAVGEQIDARSRNVWRVLPLLSPRDAATYGGVRAVIDWHARHRFCAVCGTPTRVAKGGWARQCANDDGGCGAEHFPRVDPVVIMLGEHDGRVLLGRQPAFPAGRYSALAGFVEPGEAIEDAVIRELHEEAGVRARNVRYIASQPWPFPSSLMVACIAQCDDAAITIDTKELDDARWFTRDAVVAAMRGDADAEFVAPPPFAIAHNLLQAWLAA